MNPDECLACIIEREEYGCWRCPAHYDPIEDNRRAIEQTGIGINDTNLS